nr:superoxide dismutase [uncultured Mediterraneibacter sp.]
MNHYYPFINTPLPYSYDALEPFIDEKTMHLHHDRHLQTYIDNLNRFLEENPALQMYSLEEMLILWRRLPCHLQAPLRNNAGGVYNHRFYFNGMKSKDKGFGTTASPLFEAMTCQFGSPENFKKQFKAAALSVFGSGYAWLVSDGGRLRIVTSSNQNTPVLHFRTLILNIDVWEHAYYLKHYNMRAAYIDDWFRVVNWSKAGERFSRRWRKENSPLL